MDGSLQHVSNICREEESNFVKKKGCTQNVLSVPSETTTLTSAKKNIETILRWLMQEKVGTISIKGERGVGRRWLARQVVNRAVALNIFDTVIWLEDSSNSRDSMLQILVQLVKEDQLVKEEEEEEVSNDRLKKMVSVALEDKRYLLVLTDATLSMDVDLLGVPLPKQQKKSSKVLITTSRIPITANRVLEVYSLTEEESWLLFCEQTGTEIQSTDIQEFVKPLLEACEGVPLIILTLAGALRNLNEDTRLISMSKLERATEIRTSRPMSNKQFFYEMLPSKVIKDSFLYCTMYTDNHHISVKGLITSWMMEGFLEGFNSLEKAYKKGLYVLKELVVRNLLTKVDEHHVTMHSDLRPRYPYIIDEGRDVVLAKTVPDLFKEKESYKKISFMNESLHTKYPDAPEDLNPSTLFLHGNENCLHGNENCLPTVIPGLFFEKMQQLKVLSLFHLGMRSLPPSISKLKNLEVLMVKGCSFLEDVTPIEGLGKLVLLSLSGAKALKKIPDDFFKGMVGLKSLDLSDTQLQKLPLSFSGLGQICRLFLRGCSYLKTLPYHKDLSNLIVLDVSGASALSAVPYANLKNIELLDLSGTLVDKLPSFGKRSKVQYLLLRGCSRIETVPSPDAFYSLKMLDISGASSIREFQCGTIFNNFGFQPFLDFSETHIVELPEFNVLSHVRHFLLRNCANLVTMPSLGGQLQVLDLSGSTSFKKFQDESLVRSLITLDLSGTQIEQLPNVTEGSNLRQLLLRGCLHLKRLPHLHNSKLKVLDLSGCIEFREFRDDSFDKLCYLRTLNVSGTKVAKLPTLSGCIRLERLLLRDCSNMETLPHLENLIRLKLLDLSGATAFKEFQDYSLGQKDGLREVDLSRTQIIQLPAIFKCQNLRKLILRGCSKLESLPQIENLTRLKVLDLSGASSFMKFQDQSFGQKHELQILDLSKTQVVELPSLSGCMNLSQLLLRDCPKFRTVPNLKELARLEVLDLSGTKVAEFSFLSECSNLLQLSLRGCSNLEMLSFEGMHKLQKLDLSESSIQKLPSSLAELQKLRQISLQGCSNLTTVSQLKVLREIEVLHLSRTDVRQFPTEIFRWPHLKFLEMLDRKYLWGFDRGSAVEVIKQLCWDPCKAENVSVPCIHITVSNTDIFSFVENKSELWDIYFQKFHFCLCSPKEWGKQEDIYLNGNKFDFGDTYYQSSHSPRSTEPDKFFKICGFETFPIGIEEVLCHVELLYLKNNPFIQRLSDLGAENIKVMRECWIERCDRMESAFYGEEIEENVALGRSLEILWVSNLSELRSLFRAAVQPGSFICLKHLHIECCPSLTTVFSSHMELKNLETMKIKFCDKLENVFGELALGEQTLPKLYTLTLWKLPQLKSICAGVLPSLQKLRVKRCPQLQKLPVTTSTTSTPVEISGELVWWSNVELEDKPSKPHVLFTQWRRFL